MARGEPNPRVQQLERDIERLEHTIRSAAGELRRLRTRFRDTSRKHMRAELDEICDEWEDLHYR